MTEFTFEGFTTGTPVDLSATQGGTTVNGAVATWGQETVGSATIDIASSEPITSDAMTMVQHDSARFVPTGWVDFDTPETHAASGNIYKPRFHDIVYFWDTGKTGDFATPDNLLPAHKSRQYAHGPVINICYETSGVYPLRLYAYEPSSGKFASKTITITVVSADSEYPGSQTICVNPAGDSDFTGAPPGAIQTNCTSGSTFNAGHSEWSPGGAKKRYLFKGGASFDFEINMAKSGVTSGLMFSSYGSGRATLDISNDAFPSVWRDSTLKRVLINNLNFDGGHDILTGGGGDAICTMGRGTHLVVSECLVDGFAGTVFNMTDGATDPEAYCYFHFNELEFGPNLSGQYPILSDDFTAADTTFAATGCKWVRSPQNDYDDTGNRSIARLNGHQWCYLQACEIYNGGNAQNTQPPLKLAERGDTPGGVYSVHCCSVESGGGPAMLFKHNANTGVHSNLIARQNRFSAINTGGAPYETISLRAQGVSFDSNIVEALGTANQTVGQTRAAIWFRPNSTAAGLSPNYVRSNTIVNHKGTSENNGSAYDMVIETGGASGWSITVASNVDHRIGYGDTPDGPLEDGPAGVAYYDFHQTGRRTGGSFDTGYAATPAQAFSYRPEAGSAALGDAGATFYPFPVDAQTENDLRPSGSEDRGCWQGSV